MHYFVRHLNFSAETIYYGRCNMAILDNTTLSDIAIFYRVTVQRSACDKQTDGVD